MKNYTLNSSRIAALRESALSKTPSVCIERARYITKSYKENEAASVYIKRAKALEAILENMSIYIKDNELIIGNQSSDERTAPIFPEYAVDWMAVELKEKGNFDSRDGDKFYLDPAHHSELHDIISYWQGRNLQAECKAQMPVEISNASTVKVIHGDGNMTSGDGHIIPDFEKALHLGLNGIIDEAKARLETIILTESDAFKKRDFLQATIIVNEAVIAFAQRFSSLAFDLAASTSSATRKHELLTLSKICSHIPANKPRTFWEALQMTWFIHLVIQIESNGHSASLGRLDQYLFPYYQHDIDNGILTADFAKELLQCTWVKLYSILKIRPTSHSGYGAGYPTYQNVTLSGSKADGSDATNALSYLILESVGEAKLTQPNLSARLHGNSPEKFIRKCAEVIALGFGMPALHTDEIIVPALLAKGVEFQDAYNYSMVGCVEVAVPGKWGYRCTGMTFLNFIKAVELTLNDGFDARTGLTLLNGNGSLETFETFDDLMHAFEKNIAYYTQLTVALDLLADTNLEKYPDIFCSALTNCCIERAKALKEGGAKYDIIAGLQVGLANATNALYAIKKLVFETETLSKSDLSKALKENFAGLRGEQIKNQLLSVDKYGNDIDDVDNFANVVYNCYIKEISNHKNSRFGKGPIGGSYGLSTSGISSNVPMGTVTGATPDGRMAFTPAAEGASPTQGTDTKGPTAVLNTISKLPNILMTGGQLLNQKFSPQLVNTPIQFEKFIAIIKSFVQKKGWHVQFNIIDTETLKKAQKDPEKYRDIIVRIAGYCAQFVTLDPTTQNDIISRTQQEL